MQLCSVRRRRLKASRTELECAVRTNSLDNDRKNKGKRKQLGEQATCKIFFFSTAPRDSECITDLAW